MKARILIVDDEPGVVDLVRYNFEKAGFDVDSAVDGTEALEKVRGPSIPDLILLDVMLPGLSGWEVCKILRSHPQTTRIPIIMLTAKAEEVDRIIGLELGADDYVTKPFSPRELLLRVKKRLELASPQVLKETFQIGILKVDISRHRVTVKDRKVDLTAIEFRLLVLLIQRIGRVQSRDQLLRDVWEYDSHIDTRTVDTHVRRLRDKLGQAANNIDTVRGVGYRFLEEIE